MIARCITDRDSVLTKGRTYEVTQSKDDRMYVLTDDGGYTNEKFKDKFEVINDKGLKTFKEVITNIKDGEVWVCSTIETEIKRMESKIYIGNSRGKGCDNHVGQFISDENKFGLRRNKVSFTEAFESYEKGLEIESCISELRFKGNENNEIRVMDGRDMDVCTEEQAMFSIEEIKGKWFVN